MNQLSFADLGLPAWRIESADLEILRDTGKRGYPDDHPALLAYRRAYLDSYWQQRGYFYNTETFEYEWITRD